jgi:hypothetical protein
MNPNADQPTPQLQAALQSRQSAQRMRQLATGRAERLELKLKEAAESGVRVEISRTLAIRARLQTEKRKLAARFASVAALGILLGAATSGLALVAAQRTDAPGLALEQTSPLRNAPGDKLNLAFSYSVSTPVAR